MLLVISRSAAVIVLAHHEYGKYSITYGLTIFNKLLHCDDTISVGVQSSKHHLNVGLHVLMGVLENKKQVGGRVVSSTMLNLFLNCKYVHTGFRSFEWTQIQHACKEKVWLNGSNESVLILITNLVLR